MHMTNLAYGRRSILEDTGGGFASGQEKGDRWIRFEASGSDVE